MISPNTTMTPVDTKKPTRPAQEREGGRVSNRNCTRLAHAHAHAHLHTHAHAPLVRSASRMESRAFTATLPNSSVHSNRFPCSRRGRMALALRASVEPGLPLMTICQPRAASAFVAACCTRRTRHHHIP